MLHVDYGVGDDSESEAYASWMYDGPSTVFNANLVVASSPSGPDDPLHDDTDGKDL